VPVIMTVDRATVACATGVSRRTLERWLYKGVLPHPRHEDALVELARENAAAGLRVTNEAVPGELTAMLHAYISVTGRRRRASSAD